MKNIRKIACNCIDDGLLHIQYDVMVSDTEQYRVECVVPRNESGIRLADATLTEALSRDISEKIVTCLPYPTGYQHPEIFSRVLNLV